MKHTRCTAQYQALCPFHPGLARALIRLPPCLPTDIRGSASPCPSQRRPCQRRPRGPSSVSARCASARPRRTPRCCRPDARARGGGVSRHHRHPATFYLKLWASALRGGSVSGLPLRNNHLLAGACGVVAEGGFNPALSEEYCGRTGLHVHMWLMCIS